MRNGGERLSSITFIVILHQCFIFFKSGLMKNYILFILKHAQFSIDCIFERDMPREGREHHREASRANQLEKCCVSILHIPTFDHAYCYFFKRNMQG